ncbi:MAG: hypothetical protein ACKO04_00770 [Actinomycetes bacterium]
MKRNRSKGGHDRATLDDELSDARVDEAARARRQARWTTERRDGERSLVDVLAAATGAVVVVGTSDGAEHRGQVGTTGTDAVELTTGPAQLVLPLAHVVTVRTTGPVGRVAPRGDWTLVEALTDLVGTGRTVRVGVVGSHTVVGEVDSVGRLLTLRTPNGTTYVEVGAVASVAG